MSEGSMNRAPLVLLYLNVLVIATCGLVYELLAGTLASSPATSGRVPIWTRREKKWLLNLST